MHWVLVAAHMIFDLCCGMWTLSSLFNAKKNTYSLKRLTNSIFESQEIECQSKLFIKAYPNFNKS